jgi:tripartite-type tricarboxylate transporter receptor subunit TctC
VLNGEVQVLMTNAASVLPHINGGRLRPIGVTAMERTAQAPDVPTLHESGLQGFEYATWYGAWLPSAVPRPLLVRLHDSFQKALALPVVNDRLVKTGLKTYRMSQVEFTKYVERDMERWKTVIESAGIKAD